MSNYLRTHLQQLEAEAIFVIRETAAQFERPVLLFSGGKDSIVMAHLAQRAFWPGQIPFPLLHIDTGHNFPETLTYRDGLAERLGVQLIVRSVQDSIDRGRAVEEPGHNPHGALTLCTFISPFAADRDFARSLLPAGRFFEIYVKCDLEVAVRRDPKGLYARALRGEIKEFTGISAPYEAPANPELVIETDLVSAEDAVEQILAELAQRGVIRRA